MEPIKIRDIKDISVDAYRPDGTHIGTINNELQFLDFRFQIAERNEEGYYIIFNNEKVLINRYGVTTNWVNGLFDSQINLLRKLLKMQINRKKEENENKRANT